MFIIGSLNTVSVDSSEKGFRAVRPRHAVSTDASFHDLTSGMFGVEGRQRTVGTFVSDVIWVARIYKVNHGE